ncbi:MAG: 30S ribosomal protein S12 methylthiotransferase RimO [Deltaproteobacteria bacterium CG_4_8_14_3_um_filter_51_11]|nr:30S ribosomal protein S12 methylthiotransferase RimO [bacterium]OIP43799.1 MAG: ribosomal protein S12 methylthiotransferase RimO [Desulfobacteraceae bacterium CG2_30_51_40]PIP47123.1 MAG: 30S ribosomal protein S12 methylthiotransferase RimO [Deltaproteobacteria bacterium CG23_combo_of_CG06-09_8_20_14_all_51_20]PIX19306.1 MAG: 30S ribosomal protein S12 methylthiotransferase RimO [Deltaproteobacteria bacterium CG_4_8_14_3_um_filter_51_11]PIY21713.1 MAG: 30S ribosomal protein S12 methylthiotran
MPPLTRGNVFVVSLGCAKNLVDSEHMLGMISSAGFNLCGDIDEAEVAVINTCGFIAPAAREAIDTILEVAGKKKEGKLRRLVVTGCLFQRYGYKIKREMPEVDAWLGTSELHRIVEAIENPDGPAARISRPCGPPFSDQPRLRTTPFYSAYMKIAEGCSNRCTYCTIPAIRGPLRSRSIEDLVSDAKLMRDEGVKEINLIAQDTTGYGRDIYGRASLEDLLEALLKVDAIPWIRVLYSNPAGVTDRLLNLLEGEERLCPYLDIPVQHVNTLILRLMGRPYDRAFLEDIISNIRSRKRRISVRTTVMVGFPGETQTAFNELEAFMAENRFDYLGSFVYSPEKGTSAERLPERVPRGVARRRMKKIMSRQAEISLALNRGLIGSCLEVLVEGPSEETDLLLKGRTAVMAPDVDVQVLINKGTAVVGEFYPVLITDAHPYDLIGEVKDVF